MGAVRDPVKEVIYLDGDWEEEFEAYLDDSTPEDISAYTINASLTLRPAAGQAEQSPYRVSTTTNDVVITAGAAGRFQMKASKAAINSALGAYPGDYDLKIVFVKTSGEVSTLYAGQRRVELKD